MREIGLFPAEAGFNDPDALIKWEQWELSHDDEAGVLSTKYLLCTANHFPFSTPCIIFDTTEIEKQNEKRSLTEKKEKNKG